MGLRQEAETSLGNQPDRLLPHPAVAGLSQFVQHTIQGLTAGVIGFAGAHGILPSVSADPLPQSTETTRLVTAESSTLNPLTLELSERVTQEIVKPLADQGIDIDLTGELLTNAWIDDQGNRNILYRNILFQVGMDGQLAVADALTELDQLSLDQQINQEYLGIDPIPPKSDQPISADQLDPDVQSVITTLGQSLGFDTRVTGSESYGPYNIFRIEDKFTIIQILEGPQAGQIQLGNIGLQLLHTPNVPEYVVLSPLPFASGGGTTEIPAKPVEKSASYQRVVNNLRELLTSIASGSTGVVSNPEGLDPAEVDEYIAHPEQTVFNTFRIWSKPNGDPWLIIVTGERLEGAPAQGLTKMENIVNVMAALDRLYATDPQIFDTLEQYGLKAIAGHVPFFEVTGAAAMFGRGRIYLNEVNTPDPAGDPLAALSHMYTILVEARHMYNLTLSSPPDDILDPANLGIDKALWANNWLDAHSEAFTAGNQRSWRSLSRQVITAYTNNPALGRHAYWP